MIGGLTKQQRKALTFITGYCKAEDISPTFDEIKTALSLKSKSGVHRIISALEERGMICRLRKRSRGISLVQKKCPHCGGPL